MSTERMAQTSTSMQSREKEKEKKMKAFCQLTIIVLFRKIKKV